jgi:hypothetical protein
MKIRRFHLEHLTNGEWFYFILFVKNLIETCTPSSLGIEPLYGRFVERCAKASEAIGKIRKSYYTREIAAADKLRNRLFRGLVRIVAALLLHFDGNIQCAARRIKVVLDHYGYLYKANYVAKSAGIDKLCHQLTVEHADDVALLDIGQWIVHLQAASNNFSDLLQSRFDENITTRNKPRFRNVRRETDPVYRDIIDHIEAGILIKGEESFAYFVEKLNPLAESYANSLALRKGHSQSNRKSNP